MTQIPQAHHAARQLQRDFEHAGRAQRQLAARRRWLAAARRFGRRIRPAGGHRR